MLHEPSARDIKMASPYLQARGCSSSDLLAHHKGVSSYDPMSRSLDASCASSYTTNDPLITIANTDNPIVNPLVASSCASSYTTNVRLIRAANTDNLAANSSNQEMISPIMDFEGPKDVKMVPFKWEEAPGRPMDTSSSNGLVSFNPSSLQLPPKLQCQSHESPLRLMLACPERPLRKKLRQPITHSLSRSPPNKHIVKRLCTYVLKTASCSGHGGPPLHKFSSHSWSNPPCVEFSSTTLHQYKHDKLAFNDRLFFDRHSPKDLRHCASMDSILPVFDDPDQREDEFVSRKALSFLAMEEQEEAESSTTDASSPWEPMSFHEREGSASPWQPAPTIKVVKKLADEEDDDDDDEGFHDIFSRASSSVKPSQRTTDDGMESACSSPSPSPWYLDFSPEEEEVHVERMGSKLVALIKLKGVISRKVISKFKRRGEGVNHQLAESTIWSPTLATYLHNQQLEEEKQIKTPISSAIGANCDDGQSEMGSNRLKIDPNYYLPATIRTHLLNPNHYYHQLEEEKIPIGTNSDDGQSEFGSNRLKKDPNYYLPATNRTHSMNPNHYYSDDDEDLTPSAAHDQERQDKESSIFTEEEEERHNLQDSTHRLSLREQLVEFGDEYLAPPFYEGRHRDSRTLDGHPDNHFKARQPPSACKGMCKVRKTVKLVASTIKLIWVHTEIGHKKGAQRSFHTCIKPTVNN